MLQPLMPTIFTAALLLFAGGAIAALVFARKLSLCRIVSHGLALSGGCLVLAMAVAGLAGASFETNLPAILPWDGGLSFGLDRLSAFFLLIIAAGVIPACFYAIGYARRYGEKMPLLGFMTNLFVAAMVLVPLSRNVLTFLFFWELMSLASYFLVMTDSEEDEIRDAGWTYLLMTHAGLGCLLIAFLMMEHDTGSAVMSGWASAAAAVGGGSRNFVFIVMTAGFISKAGAVPFQIWLPRAHPAAPSHVSALMSGVMIKMGIYGVIRMALDWLGPGPAWWGAVIVIAGAVSAILGVLYALVESDLKRLLAYSSVENIGIILLGAGAGMIFRSYQLGALAGLALIAALFHSLNHTVFKGLLFLSAGSVVQASGTRNIEELGGVLRRMPQTART